MVSDRNRCKTHIFSEFHWWMVPLEPKYEKTGDAAAQSVQNVKEQACGKLSLSLGENFARNWLKCHCWSKSCKTEPRPNHARTTMGQKINENGKNRKRNTTRTMPEPRPNHARTMMCKPEVRSDSKDATPFDKFQKNMIFMEKS